MKRLPILIQILILSLGLNTLAQAKSATKKQQKPGAVMTKKGTSTTQEGQLGTNFSFDSASVRGKYQMAGQGIAIVEDEKVLDDLLGLRRSFKDREKQENSRR